MRLGVAWYPEQHPPERWADDVRRMAASGLDLVRMGEFAWVTLEPRRGRFEWDGMDLAIELAVGAGLEVVLATPTAAPPIWLAMEHPEILSMGPDGQRQAYGTRRSTCPVNRRYRTESRRIVSALVDRYGKHPGVVAWQLDNEPGHHDSARCWCPDCDVAFQAWLQARYDTIGELNRAWGTVFWGGSYPSFEAIRLPRASATNHSPSLLLAHRRFASANVVEGIAEQHALVDEGAPGRVVFSNLPAAQTNLEPRPLARLGGRAAIDIYPTAEPSAEDAAFLLDLAIGHTGMAWVTEHQPGPINWTPSRPPVPPGMVQTWGWRAALHGVEALLFFSWRPARSGSEQYHSGLLRHDGTPDRALEEITQLGTGLASLPPALLQRPRAPVALLWSADDQWTLDLDPHHPGLTHRTLVVAAYAGARRLGIEVDVVSPETDLRPYTAVLAPALQIATPDRIGHLREAAASGTMIVLGARTLVKDMDGCTLETAHPSGLAELLGARVTESHAPEAEVSIQPFGLPAGPWTDVLELTHDPGDGATTEVVARFGGATYQAGLVAAVRRENLVYAGFSSAEAWAGLLRGLLSSHLALDDMPPECERFVRDGRVIDIDMRSGAIAGLEPYGVPSARTDGAHGAAPSETRS